MPSAPEVARALVGGRLRKVRAMFPTATRAQLVDALQYYSPESRLVELTGDTSRLQPALQPAKLSPVFQGELAYGSDVKFHEGLHAVLGKEEDPDVGKLAGTAAVVGVVGEEMLRCGGAEDRYNLWYFRYCPAREQVWYNSRGERKPGNVVDQGHEGMRLADFAAAVNARLEHAGSSNRVTAEQVLSVRMYTGSTFRLYNNALRARGKAAGRCEEGKSTSTAAAAGGGAEVPCRRSILLARRCLILMQAIPRAHKDSSYRGVTGYLGRGFRAGDMGMDYAFFSTTSSEAVAAEFATKAEKHVVFEVQYVRACSGVDVEVLSVFPAEKEILFPPCIGLSLMDQNQDQVHGMFDEYWEEREGTGRVKVSPAVAN